MKKLLVRMVACVLFMSLLVLPVLASDASSNKQKKANTNVSASSQENTENEEDVIYCNRKDWDGNDCTGVMVRKPDQIFGWYTVGYVACSHNDPWATDAWQERYVVKVLTCNNCGVSQREDVTETRYTHGKPKS